MPLNSGQLDRESESSIDPNLGTMTIRLGLNTPPDTKSAYCMQYQFREGDWVRHHSFTEPIRVIGIGSTIAVQLPNGEMRAFEPEELERVLIAKVPRPTGPFPERRQDRRPSSAKGFASLAMSIGLICLIILVLAMIAGGTTLNLLR
jgi:hypothetical protein